MSRRPNVRSISNPPALVASTPPAVPGQIPNEAFRSDTPQDFAPDNWNALGVGIQWPPLDTCSLDAGDYMWLFPFNWRRGGVVGRVAVDTISGGVNLRWGIYTNAAPGNIRPDALLIEFPPVLLGGGGIDEVAFGPVTLPTDKALWLALFPETGIKISGISLGYVAPILPMLDPLSGLTPTQRLRVLTAGFGPLPDPCPAPLEPEFDPCPLVFLAPPAIVP